MSITPEFVPPVKPAPMLTNAPMSAPADFATQSVGKIFNFVGAIAPPLLTLAIAGIGLKTILGKPPKILKNLV